MKKLNEYLGDSQGLGLDDLFNVTVTKLYKDVTQLLSHFFVLLLHRRVYLLHEILNLTEQKFVYVPAFFLLAGELDELNHAVGGILHIFV
jgi:hypothetical protein